MSTRDPDDLTPEMFARYQMWSVGMTEAGLWYILTRVACDYQEQVALFAQGRNNLNAVNWYRKLAGLAPIPRQENHIVTWTLNSFHIVSLSDNDSFNDKSRAFDFAITTPDNRRVLWDLKVDTNTSSGPDYHEAGVLWEGLGGVWGGRWAHPDCPHCQ
jgi:hypothetical protein